MDSIPTWLYSLHQLSNPGSTAPRLVAASLPLGGHFPPSQTPSGCCILLVELVLVVQQITDLVRMGRWHVSLATPTDPGGGETLNEWLMPATPTDTGRDCQIIYQIGWSMLKYGRWELKWSHAHIELAIQ